MLHFCTMHHPPLSRKWTGKDHRWGRGLHEGWHTPSRPFKAPKTPQNSPLGDNVVGEKRLSCLHPVSPKVRALLLMLERLHMEGQSCGRTAYFFRLRWCPRRIGSQIRGWICVAHPVNASGGATTQCLLTSERLQYPSHCF